MSNKEDLMGFCHDCGLNEAVVTFGMGAERCLACSDLFDKIMRAKDKLDADLVHLRRQEELARHVCHKDDDVCEKCCEHEFDSSSGYECLNCGKEGLEDIMSAAYDSYKDFMKYGE